MQEFCFWLLCKKKEEAIFRKNDFILWKSIK